MFARASCSVKLTDVLYILSLNISSLESGLAPIFMKMPHQIFHQTTLFFNKIN